MWKECDQTHLSHSYLRTLFFALLMQQVLHREDHERVWTVVRHEGQLSFLCVILGKSSTGKYVNGKRKKLTYTPFIYMILEILQTGVEANRQYRHSFRPYCSQHKGSFVLNTKGLLFSCIYVNIVLFSTQRVFCFQLFMYCSQHKGSFILSICVLFLIQRVFCIRHLCQYCIILDTKGLLY